VQRVTVDRRRSHRLRSGPAIAALLLAVAVVGCGGSATPPPTPRPTPSAPAASGSGGPSSPAASGSPAAASGGAGSFDPATAHLGLRLVVAGFDSPLDVVDPGDGSHRLFVVEQGGQIRIVKDGALLPTPFLDIHDRVSCCGERGLLGLAFAPDYGASDDRFFLDYTDTNGDTAIAEGSVGPDPDVADPASLKVVLSIAQPFPNHNGGNVIFGPDGYLYIGMGDGGSGGDPLGNGQRLDTLLGKLLRIDVTSPPPDGKGYAIPPTNPFVGRQGAMPEIWAYGLRNPWRFSFDRSTGALWIGDVGQGRYEEVDRALDGGRGANYGWNIMEGSHCYPDGDSCDKTGLVLPLAEYDHSLGDCAIVGGYVYRGSAYPALSGAYIFGDECTGYIRAVDAAGPDQQTPTTLVDTHRAISSFGQDEAGELYLTDLASGGLYQVISAP
jgi:glucose/arabinose dehydrogenase